MKLPWIFPGAPLKVNGAPGNIQGNLDGYVSDICYDVELLKKKSLIVEMGLTSLHHHGMFTYKAPSCRLNLHRLTQSRNYHFLVSLPKPRPLRWLGAKLQHLQCISNGDTAVLHKAIDLVSLSFHWNCRHCFLILWYIFNYESTITVTPQAQWSSIVIYLLKHWRLYLRFNPWSTSRPCEIGGSCFESQMIWKKHSLKSLIIKGTLRGSELAFHWWST